MKHNHRGWEIEVVREKCMSGYPLTYFHATRLRDGFMMIDSFTEGTDSVRTILNAIKQRVDDAIDSLGESECCTGKFSVEEEQRNARIFAKFIGLLAKDEPTHAWVIESNEVTGVQA